MSPSTWSPPICGNAWSRSSSSARTDPGPASAACERLQTDPRWRNNLLFNEYFHGDNGAGLGACHQTGWTGLVADVILRRHGAYPAVSGVIRKLVLGERT